jgi:nitroreductase
MLSRKAVTDHPVHELIAKRWSPYAFADRSVAERDLRSLFEAARWAPSSYNEQPWSYIVATTAQPEDYQKILSCLVEANQEWAKAAPVLALGIATLRFARNGKPNKAAIHDLGLAAGGLLVEATARGLVVHQMIGIEPERARELFGIPEGSEAVTGLAIGYQGNPATLPEKLRERDQAPRRRKALNEFVFGTRWGEASSIVA